MHFFPASSSRRRDISLVAAAAAAVAASVVLTVAPVSAFTNGTLIPPYICDLEDLRIGGPSSLGAVVPLLTEDDAQAKIAGYHFVRAPPYTAQDLCTASIATAGQTTVKATTDFIVSSKDTAQKLVGLIVWVQDLPNMGLPRKIGMITTPGLNMVYYPYRGCGTLGQTIVHQTALDDDAAVKSQSAAFTWTLGNSGVAGTSVMVRGVCITSLGYGAFTVAFQADTTIANSFNAATNGNYDGSGKGVCPASAVKTTTTPCCGKTTTMTTTSCTSTTTKSVTTLSTKTTMTTTTMMTTTTAKTTGSTAAVKTTTTGILVNSARPASSVASGALGAFLAAGLAAAAALAF
ncbi:hypothetical protein DFJ73DRAFT_864617 [Zopfochytrium polystomum]|nr:hypothetical protein DFJ73DRAFT_864617 [Zopfochytrium polystomum]